MTRPTIQTSFISGEISPSLWGRTDKPEYRNGASTMRNYFVNYRGGATSRAGLAYVGMCRQGAPNGGGVGSIDVPPRDINFQISINQGYALEFGEFYMRVKSQGAYVTEASEAITGITKANPGVFSYTNTNYTLSDNDWIYISGVTGMKNFNGLTWIVKNATAGSFTVTDLFGNSVDTTAFSAYVSGGTLARIYTVASPYAAADLPYLKFTQNATVMNLTCWNQTTNKEYAPYTLQKVGSPQWTFTPVSFSTTAITPTGVSSKANNSTTINTWYGYAVTSINSSGDESFPSSVTYVQNNDIAINAGTNTVTWNAVTASGGATSYNIYATQPVYYTGTTNVIPIGAQLGYLGSAFGTQFIDTNITADFTRSPPMYNNPFARGQILDVLPTAYGGSYTQSSISYSIGTTNGTGFAGTPIVVNGNFVGFYITNNGSAYASGDTIVISDSGSGHGGTATLSIGAATGTYPGTCAYFQQRLVYADTINNPDTYYMSQPGSYNNFDTSIPTTDADAVTGTPWGQQINGIQFMVPSINGLLTFTGNGVWVINGGNAVAVTDSSQNALAQAQIGCSAIVPPLYINLHVLYVQAKNSIVRDIAYNFYFNVFNGTDITVFSNHLFISNTITQWAYAEEPYKVVWAVRNDGVMLSLTYVKEQEVQAWARHDTNGLFVGVCSVIEPPNNEDVSFTIEPPTDTIYTIVKRYITGHETWVYYSEQMNNRIWQNVEDCFCVDAGLFYPLTFPAATLTPAALTGTNNITSTSIAVGGSGYTNPTALALDSSGSGTGAAFNVTQVGGVITAVTPVFNGTGYNAGTTRIIINDPTGTGAVVYPVITNYVTFTASASVFTSANVGDVIRVDGGAATVVTYNSGTSIVANVTRPLTDYIPNDPNFLPTPAISGTWSISTPITTVTGLNHLEGMTVSILADGGVQPQQVVTNGSIALQNEASCISIGLPYTCQLQTLYLNPPMPETVQGMRKDISSLIVRLENSRGMTVGTNQPDQSTEPNNAIVAWTDMKEIKERGALVTAGSELPLYTGDYFTYVPGDWSEKGQVAIQQTQPLPCSVTAVVANYTLGDTPS